MHRTVRWHLALVAGACLVAGAASAWAQGGPAAGRFLSVTGDVQVQGADGKRRGAARGAEFREGETIVTGPDSLAQMRTADGGLVSVRADTEMKLDKFAYAGESDGNASFLVSLVKGGFRTITGLIGRANRDGYKVSTPSATIGIRGTHYELVHVPSQGGAQPVSPGTYNRVFDGITTMQNKVGVLVLINRDQTGFVSLPGNVAPVLVTPPNPIFGRPTPVPRLVPQSSSGGPAQSAGGGDARSATGGAAATTLVRPTTTLTPITTTISPIDSTTAIRPSTTTTISPATSTLVSPITTTTTISPTTSTLSTTTLTAPTTTIAPTTSTLSTTTLTAPTTTISPTTTTISPTTTTISPTTTTISPATTTILK